MNNIFNELITKDSKRITDFIPVIKENSPNTPVYCFINSIAFYEIKMSGVYAEAYGTITPETINIIYKMATKDADKQIKDYTVNPNTAKAPLLSTIAETLGIVSAARKYIIEHQIVSAIKERE